MSLIGRGNKPSYSSVPTQMPPNTAMTRGRRLAGPAALVATAGGLAAIAVHDQWNEWGIFAFAGIVGIAGLGLGRRSLVAQVLSRATAWTVLAPTVLITIVSTLTGGPEWIAAAMAAGSGAALLLARPMLHTPEARSDFAPTSYRSWLFAGATASVMASIVTGLIGFESMQWHPGTAVAFLALSLSLLASAIGVVRMRAWGVLLGGLASVVTFVTALALHDVGGAVLSLAAIPGFMLLAPVLIAQRRRKQAGSQSSFTRVASHGAYEPSYAGYDAPARVRIADDSSGSIDAYDAPDEDAGAAGGAAAASPPARAQA